MCTSIVSTIFAAAALLAAPIALGAAQDYPSRPIRMLIPFPPGGGADIAGRVVGQKLSERLGVQIVIDNRPGASTLLATEIASHATPDGYTLLMATSNHAINPAIFAKRTFDEIKDFTPIVLINASANLLAVSPSQPIKSIPDLIAQAKARPGKITYGTGGHGTLSHLAVEMFALRARIDIQHVPYKGGIPAVVDTMSGQIAMAVSSVPSMVPYTKTGKLRGIGVTSAKRASSLPDVPTIAEQGFPGYQVDYWLGIMGPAKLPPAIVERINRETNAILKQADVIEQFQVLGAEVTGGTPAEFSALLKREVKDWADVVKAVNFKPM
jgi:tripartite-type tricarboxylate transporter receptor subunit TctC